jgi:hypothetical protein
VAEQVAEAFEDVRRERCGPRDEEAHRLPDRLRGLRRRFEQADVDGGDAEEERRLKVEKLGDGGLVIEALEETHAAAADEPRVQTVAEGVNVEEREREEEAVVTGDAPRSQQVDGVRQEVVVRQDGAFGCAGGAGGVDDRHRVVAVEGDVAGSRIEGKVARLRRSEVARFCLAT